jgi:hypothetical protein
VQWNTWCCLSFYCTWLTNSSTDSLIHWLTYSLTHSLTHSLRLTDRPTDQPTLWSIVLLEKQIFTQLVRKLHYVKPEGSLSCSQELATAPYLEPDGSSPYPTNILVLRSIILSSYLSLGLLSGLFPSSFFSQNFVYVSHLPMHHTWPIHIILLIWSL